MSNTNAPFGFRPTGVMYGLHRYYTDSSTAVYLGDLMSLQAADGAADPATAGDVNLIGSAEGATLATTAKSLLAASTTGWILCADDSEQRYVTQMGNLAWAQTYIDNNADHVAGAGSAVTGLSGHVLSTTISSIAAGFRLLDVFNAADNDTTSTYARVVGKIAEHMMRKEAGV